MKRNSPIEILRLHFPPDQIQSNFQSLVGLLAILALACFSASAYTRTSVQKKLPSPDKIAGEYVKAIGGKKRVIAIRDAVYEWQVVEKGDSLRESPSTGTAKSYLKLPSALRWDFVLNSPTANSPSAVESESNERKPPVDISFAQNGETGMGANSRSAWMRRSDATAGSLALTRTLTDAEANIAKLKAALEASRFLDYKKRNVLARTVTLDQSGSEPAYVVEFSAKNGARLRYWFGVSSKLLLKSRDERGNLETRFSDYLPESGLLEPHRIEFSSGGTVALTLNLQSVRYNTDLADSFFDPPGGEAIDVGALLRDVDHNQEEVEDRVGDYTYTEKRTERKINGKGELTQETVKVFEVYPIADGRDVQKLISDNGVALTGEKLEKEEKRVTEELEKAQREREKRAAKLERDKLKGKPAKEDDDPGIADFLRAAELVSPRRERLRDRDAIVFDFRPRVGYKPKNDTEAIVNKLAGIMWIDPVDKQVMRLEARLVESYKMAGGLLASIRPGTAFVFEQKRMEDGVWLPVFSQVNISAKIFIFKGIELNVMQEFSNYQKFKSSFDDYKLTSPDEKSKPPSNPNP
jgi:hypothetical protein